MFPAKPFPRTAGLVSIFLMLISLGGARAGELVYVPTGDAGAVDVIDAATGGVLERPAGFPEAHGLAASPDGRFIVVGSYSERREGMLPEAPEGVSAGDHAAHHQGGSRTDALAQPAVSTVSVFDRIAGKTVRRIDVPGAVHHVAISRDSTTAIVTQPGIDSVTAVDLQTFEVIATIETGSSPNYALFLPGGDTIAMSASGENRVQFLNTKTWRIDGTVDVGDMPEHLVLSPDGTRLYVNNVGDGSVTVIDALQRRVVSNYELGTTLHGLALAESGGALIVSMTGEDKVARIDLATDEVQTVDLPQAPYHVTSLPGAGKVYVSSATEPQITVIDPVELSILDRIEIAGIGHQMHVVADGGPVEGSSQ